MSNTEFNHTPGPWEQSHRKGRGGMYDTQVYTPDGETICTLAWYAKPAQNGVAGTYREANAQLIAAAPDLLNALDELAFLIKHNEEKGIRTDTECAEYENAIAAIQKATN